jgi:Leucine-rich repeat (LRR) protein
MVAYDPPPEYEHVDSDDESLPPPPPPSSGASVITGSSDTFDDHDLVKSVSTNTAKPVKKWRRLKREAEHVLVPQDEPQDEHEAVDNINVDGSLATNNNNNVPMQGHFRGIHNAQKFDEEEAGMDEIEVPSSSVVDRLNVVARKYAKKKKSRKLVALVVVGLAVLVAIIAGSIVGSSNNGRSNTAARDTDADADADADTLPGNPNLDTEAGRFLLSDPGIPAATKAALEDENSEAAQALDWVMNDDVNVAYGLGGVGAMESDEAKLNLKQRFAAASIGKSFDSDGFTNSDGWMTEKDVCEWKGIQCGQPIQGVDGGAGARNLQDVNVVGKINLSDNNVVGVLPIEISIFSEVTELILFTNKISGPIPLELFDLTKLAVLDLYDNNLSGVIPEDLEKLTNLSNLYLSKNNFSGQLPAAFGQLSKLEQIWINENDLTGPILDSFGDMENLQSLLLSQNDFTGGLPATFAKLQLLETLDLDENRDLFYSATDRTFPLFLLDMPALTRLSMREVFLTGEIPTMSEGKFPKLQILYLDANKFTGSLSNNIAWIQSLERLTLSNNVQLGGNIPRDLGEMPALKVLDLSGCQFDGEIPAKLSRAAMLEQIYLNGNYLTGAIPSEIGDLNELFILKFEKNSGITVVPNEVCDLGLQTLMGGCDVDCSCCDDVCLRR